MIRNKWSIVFIAAILIGGLLSLFASSSPDGLEKVAETQGFLDKAEQLFSSIMPDYKIPVKHSEMLGASIAGIIGTCAVFAILYITGKYLFKLDKE